LQQYERAPDAIVLALPRGGVPVGFEVALALMLPLDVFLVRKLGVLGHPELAMGAIAEGDVEVLNHDLLHSLGIPSDQVSLVADRERLELARRDRLFRGQRHRLRTTDRTVILVDDGLATGSTMEAAVVSLRLQNPARIVVSVPVGARETCERLSHLADSLICFYVPEPFDAVGCWYDDFDQTSDDEVIRLLAMAGPVTRPIPWTESSRE
jgi:predicted phosphoribosyltransferase